MSEPFHIHAARGTTLPIVISCPHSGIEIPPDVVSSASGMLTDMELEIPDTDWYVHELYGFAPAMGVTLVHARYSRFVIDLNRDPANQPLYTDSRHQTGLVPTTAFDKRPLYKDATPDEREVKRRVERYYRPYHAKLTELVQALKAKHRHVLLFEAHSIKRHVPTIQATPFPDMILGDQKGRTAAAELSRAALAALGKSRYKVQHNDPFMGGFITRHFGAPASGVHTLQLEMSQDIYMDEKNSRRDLHKQAAVGEVLTGLLTELSDVLRSLP